MNSDWFARFRKPRPGPEFQALFQEECGDEMVSLDTETSSLDPATAQLLSVGAVKVRNRRIQSSDSLYLLVKPQGELDRQSVTTHRLRQQDLENGLELEEVLRRLLAFIGPRPLIGYYLEFDLAILDRLLRGRFGFVLPNRRIEVSSLYFDRKIGRMPHAPIDLSFAAICQELSIPALARHTAIDDALMTAMIYLKLHGKYFD